MVAPTRAIVVRSDALWFIKCSAIFYEFGQGDTVLLRPEARFLSIAAEIKRLQQAQPKRGLEHVFHVTMVAKMHNPTQACVSYWFRAPWQLASITSSTMLGLSLAGIFL